MEIDFLVGGFDTDWIYFFLRDNFVLKKVEVKKVLAFKYGELRNFRRV